MLHKFHAVLNKKQRGEEADLSKNLNFKTDLITTHLSEKVSFNTTLDKFLQKKSQYLQLAH